MPVIQQYNAVEWKLLAATIDSLTGASSTTTSCRWNFNSTKAGAMPVTSATSAAYLAAITRDEKGIIRAMWVVST